MADTAKFQTLILMGVAGSGKSTLAQQCASALGWTHLEGDDFHSDTGKQMMAAGQPLSPLLRQQWVELLCQRLQQKNQRLPSVLSYSGLLQQQRAQIRAAAAAPLFVYLHGPTEVLAARLRARPAHFMPVSMLQSQLDTMQAPAVEPDVLWLDLRLPVEVQLRHISRALGHSDVFNDCANKMPGVL
ncbi:MAG: gluconokinase [Rheinheimera sp.]|nr:gluconokinase [Rheinheimera sp.]